MNERIKEIEKQCWKSSQSEPYALFDVKKFAELIVGECVGVADDYVKECTCDKHKNCKHPRSAIGRKIREHFGVEE